MENKSIYENFFMKYFIKKPILYMTLLVLGCVAFSLVLLSLKIPIYKTINAEVLSEDNTILLVIDDTIFDESEPIFLYKTRDLYVSKITNYEILNQSIKINENDFNFNDKTRINIDVTIGEKSLLYVIFFKGGNT